MSTNLPVQLDSLPPSLIGQIEAVALELRDAWDKRQIFRTETEMRASVLNDGAFPTPASKYWQCIREQTSMLDSLQLLAFEVRRNVIKTRRAEKLAKEALDENDADEAQIDIEECAFGHAQMMQVARDRAREILLWSKIKSELDDGSFDTTNVNTHQLVSLHEQLVARRNTLTQGSNPSEVLNVLGPLATIERLLVQEKQHVLSR